MHRSARLIIAIPLVAAIASIGPAQSTGEPLETSARRALAEARAAEAQYQRLQKAAGEARDELQRLRAQQAASAEAIAAAEARISAADVGARLIAAQVAARRQRLQREQAPATALLGGLAVMAERPPLLAILDQGSTEEFVRVRLLLDSTLPIIRARTASLRAELARGRELQTAAERAKSELVASRNLLAERRRDFTALEAKALKIANERGSEALGVGDVALARGEEAATAVERSPAQKSGLGHCGRPFAAADTTCPARRCRFRRYGRLVDLRTSSFGTGRRRPRHCRPQRRPFSRPDPRDRPRIVGRCAGQRRSSLFRALPKLRFHRDHRT